MMRNLLAGCVIVIAACGSNDTGQFEGKKTFKFGPYTLAPNEEDTSKCVQISLHNDDYANVNIVELTTGPGFHHSNWFYVPEFTFPGEDGTFNCNERGFDQAVAAIKGGVFFAQSTQSPHEVQQFPEGVAVRIPPNFKLVSQIHLLNATDGPLSLAPDIKVTFIKDDAVKTRLSGISFENEALALPPNMQSRFTVECDLAGFQQTSPLVPPPNFKIYYALAHYHELGTGMNVEAVKASGESSLIYSTTTRVGDTLGGPLTPQFDFTGYAKIRFSCDFYNNRASTVRWGVGDQEMCVFLAFSDSTYNWGGGILTREEPQNPLMVGNTMTFVQDHCTVFANDGDRG